MLADCKDMGPLVARAVYRSFAVAGRYQRHQCRDRRFSLHSAHLFRLETATLLSPKVGRLRCLLRGHHSLRLQCGTLCRQHSVSWEKRPDCRFDI